MYSDSVRRLAAPAVRGLLALPLLALSGCESPAPPVAASSFEHRGLAESTVGTLRDRGHTVQEREPGPPDAYFTGGMSGDVQLIMVMPVGSLAGWSDLRRGGLAVGYRE